MQYAVDVSNNRVKRASYKDIDTGVLFEAYGASLPSQPLITYILAGYWTGQKGKRFRVQFWSMSPDVTEDSIKELLKGANVTPQKLVDEIAAKEGSGLIKTLAEDPWSLAVKYPALKGLSISNLINFYKEHLGVLTLYEFLSPYGISAQRCERIWRMHGRSFLTICKKDPFSCLPYSYFGFELCDKMAKDIGCKPTIFKRCACAVHDVLKRELQKGNLCVSHNNLVSMAFSALNKNTDEKDISLEGARNLVTALERHSKFALCKDMVFLPEIDAIEQSLADKLLVLMSSYTAPNTEEQIAGAIQAAVATLSFRPEERQVQAVKMCLENGVSIITGGPGTGKSTVLDLFLKAARELNPNVRVVQLAPSGKAAKRMQECTKLPAYTVHKYLGAGAEINANTTLSQEPDEQADIVVVDESSMIDIFVCNLLVQVLKPGTQVVFVGDVNQLPSVGAGNVLFSMISSSVIPVTELNVIHRQGAESPIVHNAHLINEMKAGRGRKSDFIWSDDFQLVEAKNPDETRRIVEELYMSECERVGVDNVAVLTPYRKDKPFSSSVLSPALQNRINPFKKGVPTLFVMGKQFRVGDRVMQTKNRGELSNGSIGIVRKVNTQYSGSGTESMTVEFDDMTVELKGDALESIELAYAYTIHRSQGSEYKSVIIPVYSDNPYYDSFLTANLVYTAVTRAKERVILVGNRPALFAACKRESDPRATMLGDRLAAGKTV